MHRRPLGRGRTLAVIGAIVTLVGCFLPWLRVGGEVGLPQLTGNAFESSGVIVFVCAAAILFLVTLPYAAERPVAIERSLSYVLIVGLAWIAFIFRVGQLALQERLALPDRAPGLWLTALGLIVLARAAFEIAQEPSRRY